ncbi:hypothetical protein [Nocardioides sp.]|uniref:hypothetical protein n=1 Tax=Nocardioides sp. TaxID=35761 RepID=UPI002D055012|nr:hypothetical protein [Nocardioides sp.]HSX68449.1 hypothetical protein [Nocardioides sp.]
MDTYPSPAYLLGSLIEDDVAHELALKIAEGYADARESLTDEQTHKWLNAVLTKLGPMGDHPNTAMSVLCLPSEHRSDQYDNLATAAGWKEG